jgi:hypothetical protein
MASMADEVTARSRAFFHRIVGNFRTGEKPPVQLDLIPACVGTTMRVANTALPMTSLARLLLFVPLSVSVWHQAWCAPACSRTVGRSGRWDLDQDVTGKAAFEVR